MGDFIIPTYGPRSRANSIQDNNSHRDKRLRAGSISGRLRTASDLEEWGWIDKAQKGHIKDLIISGNQTIHGALESFERGDANDLQALIRQGALASKQPVDLFSGLDLDFLTVAEDVGDDDFMQGFDSGSFDFDIGVDNDRDWFARRLSVGSDIMANFGKCGGGVAGRRNSADILLDIDGDLFEWNKVPDAGSGTGGASEVDISAYQSLAQKLQSEGGTSESRKKGKPPADKTSSRKEKSKGSVSKILAQQRSSVAKVGKAVNSVYDSEGGDVTGRFEQASLGSIRKPGPEYATPSSEEKREARAKLMKKLKKDKALGNNAALPASSSAASISAASKETVSLHRSVVSRDAASASSSSSLKMTAAGFGAVPSSGASSSTTTMRPNLDRPIATSGGLGPSTSAPYVERHSLTKTGTIVSASSHDSPSLTAAPQGATTRAPFVDSMYDRPSSDHASTFTATATAASTLPVDGSGALHHSIPPSSLGAGISSGPGVGVGMGILLPGGYMLPTPGATGEGYVGAYSPEARKLRLDYFFQKRCKRVWSKKVKYDVRKNFADSRLRVKGRFVKKEEEDEPPKSSAAGVTGGAHHSLPPPR